MRVIFTLIILFFVGNVIIAQDMIKQNESSLNNMEFYQQNYSEIVTSTKLTSIEDKKIRIVLQGGYSYLLANIKPDVLPAYSNHYNMLQLGNHIGVNMNYFITKNSGFGIRYSIFNTKRSLESVVYNDARPWMKGNIIDNITNTFIGPNYSSKFHSENEKLIYISNVSFGYVNYIKDELYFEDKYIMKGNTIAFLCDLGIDYKLENNIYIGVNLLYMSGTIDEVNIIRGNTKNKIKLKSRDFENISRVDLSVGLRWYL